MLISKIYICINTYTNEVFPCKIMYNACICMSFTSYITFKKKYIYIYIIYYCYFSYFIIILFDKTLVSVGRRGPKQAKPKTVWKFLQRKKHWVPTCGNVGSSDPFPIRQIRSMPIVH